MQHYLGGKGKERFVLIKSLIYVRDGWGTWGACYKRLKVGWSKMWANN